MTGFVPASWLYDVETRSTRRHPAQQATDIEVREAIEEEPELVTDGGARVPGASYRVDCWSCGKQIAASARYCPGCGEVQLQGDEDPEIVTDGGTTSRDELIREAEEKAREEIEADALRYYKLRAELPALFEDCYREMALERGRPTEPCQCQKCDCDLHTFPGDIGCIWCSNGQHRENETGLARFYQSVGRLFDLINRENGDSR